MSTLETCMCGHAKAVHSGAHSRGNCQDGRCPCRRFNLGGVTVQATPMPEQVTTVVMQVPTAATGGTVSIQTPEELASSLPLASVEAVVDWRAEAIRADREHLREVLLAEAAAHDDRYCFGHSLEGVALRAFAAKLTRTP